eukprot:CAMPEP_0198731952 /NCGR_PEP_ID=MMETSP1475-20131203/33015_1 /TAXON_ID= ORGANISM="Unidentified sp., Strain CCMP1999" /NCGR_SAMPLE_ID=MMETSP1475 /ASSEMBLY_ACC=CAM_ASM_001111 /LENGTH=314 /DNA_ID=CAMNT_0044494981 /DNA_START=126 /DNA_END=1070 /DNA_ORIENTATION=-
METCFVSGAGLSLVQRPRSSARWCCEMKPDGGFPSKSLARKLILGSVALFSGMTMGPGMEQRLRSANAMDSPQVELVRKGRGHAPVPAANKKVLLERLRPVPVFAITDQEGRPFLAEVDNVQDGEQASVFFFSYEDAEQVLDKLKRQGHEITRNAEINVVALDEAYEKARGKPLPSGIINERGKEISVVFRFYADTREMREAGRLLKKEGVSQDMLPQVPVFLAQGLTIRLGKDFVVPLYFSKEDLEETWQNVRQKTPDMPRSPAVHVVDLIKVLEVLENDMQGNIIGFFPSRKSIEKVRAMDKAAHVPRTPAK